MKKVFTVLAFVLGCEAVGFLGSYFTISAIPTWYAYLTKPFFSPPNWLFGPVWTLLYLLMGVAAYLIWSKGKKGKNAMNLFWIQLGLNFIWTPIFFGAKNLGLAFIVIAVMWVYIVKTIMAFSKINKTASFLLYPYIAWVSFASVLNFSVWILNK